MIRKFCNIWFIYFSIIYSQDIEQLNEFANSLYENKEYYRAITEYKRINSYYPDNENLIANKIRIANCYYEAGHKIESVEIYKGITTLFPENFESVYNSAEIFSELSYFQESNEIILENIRNFSFNKKDSLNYLYASNSIKQKNIAIAKDLLSSIDENSIVYQKAQKANILLDNYNTLKTKDRKIAGILNFTFPGLGYLYIEMPQTAISTFFLESLLLLVLNNSFEQKTSGTSMLTGFLLTGIHLGATYGSIEQADKYNKMVYIKFNSSF